MINNIQFFSDFDGTITKEDTLDKLLNDYGDKSWYEIECDWISGKIGSKECLTRQMALVRPMSDKELTDFINSVEIDDYFFDFYNYLVRNNVDFYIVSDGFDYLIKRILANNNIYPKNIFCNHLEIENGIMKTFYPHYTEACAKKSGMCKCSIVNKYRKPGKTVVYAGDGMSDYCASDKVDLLFAKGTLWDKRRKEDAKNLIKFNNYGEIYSYIKKASQINTSKTKETLGMLS